MVERVRAGMAVAGLALMTYGGCKLNVPVTLIVIGALLLTGAVVGALRKPS